MNPFFPYRYNGRLIAASTRSIPTVISSQESGGHSMHIVYYLWISDGEEVVSGIRVAKDDTLEIIRRQLEAWADSLGAPAA